MHFKINPLKHIPRTLILTIISVVVLEYFTEMFSLQLNNDSGILRKIQMDFSKTKGHDFDYVVLGHSYLGSSIVPSILESKTGLTGYNLSVPRPFSFITVYCLMRNYYNNAIRHPKYVIISFDQYSCSTYFENKEPGINYLYDIDASCKDLFLEDYGYNEFIKTYIPTIKYQHFFRTLIREPNKLKWHTHDQINSWANALVKQNRGYWTTGNTLTPRGDKSFERSKRINLPTKPYRTPETNFVLDGDHVLLTNESPDEITYKTTYSPSPLCKKYLKKTLNFLSTTRSYVMFIIPSLPIGSISKYNQFIASQTKHYNNLRLYDPQSLILDNTYYVDPIHLNDRGTILLLDYVSNQLKQNEEGGLLNN